MELVQPTLVSPPSLGEFLDPLARSGGGCGSPLVASSNVVPPPPGPLLSIRPLATSTIDVCPGHPGLPPMLQPPRWDLRAFHITPR